MRPFYPHLNQNNKLFMVALEKRKLGLSLQHSSNYIIKRGGRQPNGPSFRMSAACRDGKAGGRSEGPATLPGAGGGHRLSLRLPRPLPPRLTGRRSHVYVFPTARGSRLETLEVPNHPDGHDQGCQRPRLGWGGPARLGHSLLSHDLLQDSEPW